MPNEKGSVGDLVTPKFGNKYPSWSAWRPSSRASRDVTEALFWNVWGWIYAINVATDLTLTSCQKAINHRPVVYIWLPMLLLGPFSEAFQNYCQPLFCCRLCFVVNANPIQPQICAIPIWFIIPISINSLPFSMNNYIVRYICLEAEATRRKLGILGAGVTSTTLKNLFTCLSSKCTLVEKVESCSGCSHFVGIWYQEEGRMCLSYLGSYVSNRIPSRNRIVYYDHTTLFSDGNGM